jgi:hypothetical protein
MASARRHRVVSKQCLAADEHDREPSPTVGDLVPTARGRLRRCVRRASQGVAQDRGAAVRLTVDLAGYGSGGR